MQQALAEKIKAHLAKNKRRFFWSKFVQGLCCVVVFCTTYALILPAITMEQKAFCGLEEHAHAENCGENCVAEEHRHVLACYSDPQADVETADIWEATLTEVNRTGALSEELVAVAQSQVGYEESSRNYAVGEDQSVHGYTRYGDWYGDAYGDWDAMFVSFCLHYAGAEEKAQYENAAIWVAELDGQGLYRAAQNQLPAVGDLIFYDHNGDRQADHMGIVAEVQPVREHAGASIKTIEGNAGNAVAYRNYTPDDPAILGYASVPTQEPVEEECRITETAAQIYTNADYTEAAEDAVQITLSGRLPEDAVVRAYPVELDTELDVLCAYDITIFLSDGSVYEPEAGEIIEVSIQSPAIEAAQTDLNVYHISEGGTPDPVEAEVSDGAVSFETEHFSVYAVTRADTFDVKAVVDGVNTTIKKEEKTYSIENCETLCGYRFNVTAHFSYGDQSPYWGQEAMTVTITSDTFLEKTNLEVRRVDDWNNVSTIACTHNGREVTFVTTPNASVQGFYIVIAPPTAFSSVKLEEDMIISKKIFVTQDATIDLNGHAIRPAAGYTEPLFEVMKGTLTIIDSAAAAEVVTRTTLSELGAHEATVSESGSGVALTYYVTESEVINSALGATKETVYRHEITAKGTIGGGAGPVIRVSGGAVDMRSGMLYGGTGRAIEVSGNGTANLVSGYICNFSGSSEGGAIYLNGGTLNISGRAVIAGNHAAVKGGAIYATGGIINMTGGVISGNTAASADCSNGSSGSDSGLATYGGGGIALNGATFSMTDGYLTNNNSRATGYWAGGGGIYAEGGDTVTVSGGYITGNSANGGGGIKTRDYGGGSATVSVKGGFFCSNQATYSEGGGISVGAWDTATVEGGYINNNYADCRVDWGGGGIFVANEAKMQIIGALVTENEAGGFGGGVAGCSTAKMYIATGGGGAIYNNIAAGENVSGDGSAKNQDWTYAKNSPVFMENGYADLFNAKTGTVDGSMLGGGVANWQGSCDGFPVQSNRVEDVLHSEQVMGLTSKPDEAAKDAAEKAAQVYVNGNYSYTHGGGILCNGYMIVGRFGEMAIDMRLKLTAGKTYRDKNGEALPIPEGRFSFIVRQELVDGTQRVVGTATSNADGDISFETPLIFTKAGTYTYYLSEEDGKIPGVTYDPATYRLTVKTSVTNQDGEISGITETRCAIDSIKVDKQSAGGGQWTNVVREHDPEEPDSRTIALALGDDAFVNVGSKAPTETKVTAKKVWTDSAGSVPVEVTLYRNDAAYGEAVMLTADNNWTYTWEKLPFLDEDGGVYTYTVREKTPDEFDVSYSTETVGEDQSQVITITNTRRTYQLELLKRSGHSAPVPLADAVFRVSDSDGTVLYFQRNPDGQYALCAADTEGAAAEVVTAGEDGKLVLTGLPAGTYTLEETEAPAGYQLAQPQTVILGGESMKESRSYSLTIVDELIKYELPETGGSGSGVYVVRGALLIALAVFLLYRQKKRRKEDPLLL